MPATAPFILMMTNTIVGRSSRDKGRENVVENDCNDELAFIKPSLKEFSDFLGSFGKICFLKDVMSLRLR